MFSYSGNPLSARWVPERSDAFQMQHDTEFTLDDAFDDFPRGTYSVTESMSMPQEVNTRFLRIPPLDLSLGFPSEIVCSLTQKGECIGVKDYLAVSYCWDSFPNQAERTFKISIDDCGRRREPRCPLRVLRRAIHYAVLHEVDLLWIDQECINQSDPADVEEHIQCMHLIFKEAEHAVGLLSFEISIPAQGLSFVALESASMRLAERIDTFMDAKMIDYTTRFVRSFCKDRWFSRTWVYQERFSSLNKMTLLFPVSDRVKELLRTSQTLDFGEDVAILVDNLIFAPIQWAISLLKFVPHDLDEESAQYLRGRLEVLYEAMETLNIVRLSFEDRFDGLVSEATIARDKKPWGGFGPSKIFKDIENCDNRVVSDRVAIFANVAKLERRVRTTDYRSYSVAILFQLLRNDMFPVVLVQVSEFDGDNFGFGAQDVSLSDLLCELLQVSKVVHERENRLENDLSETFEALKRTIRAETPAGMFEAEIADAMIEAERGSEDAQWIKAVLPNIKIATVAPTTAMIGEIFDGIVSVENEASENTDHDLGHWIVEYGVGKGQLPPGTEFVSFYGQWRWRYRFIEEHFIRDRAAGSRALLHADAAYKDRLDRARLARSGG